MENFNALLKALAKKGCKTADDIDIDTYIDVIVAYIKENPQAKEIRRDIENILNEYKNDRRLKKHIKSLGKINEIINQELARLCKPVRA
jgi:hypothetical protein